MKLLIFAFILVTLSSTTLAAFCEFHTNAVTYTCLLEDAVFLNPGDSFVIEGVHIDGYTDDDVRNVVVLNATLNFFPQEIFNRFRYLNQLILMNANLLQLHQPWQNCEHLQLIMLAVNNIQRIPGRIFEACRDVRTFALNNCQTTEIDRLAFSGMNEIREITMNSNSIQTLHPDTFEPCGKLERLSLNDGGLKRLHPQTFRYSPAMIWIQLSSNNLRTIESGTFLNLPALVSITFESNRQLNDLQSQAFVALPKLRTLNLRFGNLTQLNAGSFGLLPELITLNLGHNRIGQIERSFFNSFPNSALIVDTFGNDCVSTTSLRLNETAFLSSFERCFWRFEGSPDTTLGSSTISTSLVLILAICLVKSFL